MTKQTILGILLSIIVLSAMSLPFYRAQKVTSLESDRSIITVAVNDYYNRTSIVPAKTDTPLTAILTPSPGVAVDFYDKEGAQELYDYLVDVFGAADVDQYIYPIDKELLRSNGALSKLNKEERLWVIDTRNPAFIMTPEDSESGQLPPIDGGSDLDSLVEKEVVLEKDGKALSNPIDLTQSKTGDAIIGGSGTANIMQVNPTGEVTDISTSDRTEVVEYVADGSSLTYIKQKGGTYTMVP